MQTRAVTVLLWWLCFGCGSEPSEAEQCPEVPGELHWRKLAMPEPFRPGGLGEDAAFWNQGAVWLWGGEGGAIWDVSDGTWTTIEGFPGLDDFEQPRVAVAARELHVFAPFATEGDLSLTSRNGWRFNPVDGWRPMAPAPERMVRIYRSTGSSRFLYAFSLSDPAIGAAYDPAEDAWAELSIPEYDWLPSPPSNTATQSGWFDATERVVFYDEASQEWTTTDADGGADVVEAGEHVLGWWPGLLARFSFETLDWVALPREDSRDDGRMYDGGRVAVVAPFDPVRSALKSNDDPTAGWRVYDPDTETWSRVPRQCEPAWPEHFVLATDYGVIVWKQATDEDPYGEGRLLVLPDSKPLPH